MIREREREREREKERETERQRKREGERVMHSVPNEYIINTTLNYI